MTKSKLLQAIIGGVVGVASAAPLLAEPMLSIVPQGMYTSLTPGSGTQTATFKVQVSGLSANLNVVSAYDLGIIYDPDIMTLSGFSGFTDKLGDPNSLDGFFGFPDQVLNTDYLDNVNDPLGPLVAVNSVWDYRQPSPSFGAYTGVDLNPIITPAFNINEGSLRFTQLSLLCVDNANPLLCDPLTGYDDLLTLQDPANNDVLTLFTLTFDIDTSEVGSTRIQFVDDRNYAGWMGNPLGGEMDFKLNNPIVSQYLPRNSSRVSIPVPATLVLVAGGLLIGAAASRRRGAASV